MNAIHSNLILSCAACLLTACETINAPATNRSSVQSTGNVSRQTNGSQLPYANGLPADGQRVYFWRIGTEVPLPTESREVRERWCQETIPLQIRRYYRAHGITEAITEDRPVSNTLMSHWGVTELQGGIHYCIGVGYPEIPDDERKAIAQKIAYQAAARKDLQLLESASYYGQLFLEALGVSSPEESNSPEPTASNSGAEQAPSLQIEQINE